MYPHIHFDIHLRQYIKPVQYVYFVILKASEGRMAHKSDNCVSTYPALSGIQIWSGRVFCSYWKLRIITYEKQFQPWELVSTPTTFPTTGLNS